MRTGPPTAEKTWVEVSIEKNGHLEFLAVNSQPKGKVSIKLVEKVTILSGPYAGWGYAYSEYKYGNLKGAIYFVFQHDQWQGMLSGDLVGVAQQSNGLQGFMTWRLAKVNGVDSQGTVDLSFVSYTSVRNPMEHANETVNLLDRKDLGMSKPLNKPTLEPMNKQIPPEHTTNATIDCPRMRR